MQTKKRTMRSKVASMNRGRKRGRHNRIAASNHGTGVKSYRQIALLLTGTVLSAPMAVAFVPFSKCSHSRRPDAMMHELFIRSQPWTTAIATGLCSDLDGSHTNPVKKAASQKQLRRRSRKKLAPPASDADSIDKFSQDITTVLKDLRREGGDPSLPLLFRNINVPSFTNIWTRNDWKLHTSRWRYVKYFVALPTSRLLRRVLPQLSILFVWSCVSCWVCSVETQRRVFGGIQRAVLPLAPLSLVSTFVAALLTLRSNQGLSRLNEARLAFGKVVLYTREMSQLIATVVYPRNPQLGLLAARHTSIFGWLLKDFLRNYDEDYTNPLQLYQQAVCFDEDIVATMLPAPNTSPLQPWASTASLQHILSADADFILSQRKRPVATCSRLRQIFAHMQDEMTTSEQSRLDSCAQQLNKCVTICERIRASPIPPLYTAHAGRLLIFYLIFLPLALRGSLLLNNLGTILTTTVVGYAMLGLDEISFLLEEPFRLMPLYHLSKNSMKDCADAFVNMPPPLPIDMKDNSGEEEGGDYDDGEDDDADYDVDDNDGDDSDEESSVAAGVTPGVDSGETSPSSRTSAFATPTSPSCKSQVFPEYW